MPSSDVERIATLEERVADLRRDLDAHMLDASKRSDRVRELERATLLLVDAQKLARRQEDAQYRRLEVAMQRAGLYIAVGMFLLAVAMLAVALYGIHH